MKYNILMKDIIRRNLLNIPGWRTNRKIIVIESDDWGSIRMPSIHAFNNLLNSGIRVDKDLYNKFDSLASEEDLSALMDVLQKFKDKNNYHPIITANAVMANPDFEKIRKSNFQEYHYELFTETLKKYPKHNNSYSLWREGMSKGLLKFQFHGREHLNVSYWMDALRQRDKELLLAFEENVFGIPVSKSNNNRNNYMAAFDVSNKINQLEVLNTISEGLDIFKEIMGYRSKTMIAPCYTWSNEVEKVAKENGVCGFQGIYYQYKPQLGRESSKHLHFTGFRNKFRQYYLVRNVFFEPSYSLDENVNECLFRINTAFRWNKPAIIGSHRINYIGFLDEKNRKNTLFQLNQLLAKIVQKWPNVEFMSSDQLGELILNKE